MPPQPLDLSPIIRPIDRISSGIPAHLTMSLDTFTKSVGFLNVSRILKNMKTVAQPTLTISNLGRDPVRDPGEMATMPRRPHNTTPIPHHGFGTIFHYDIGHGCGTAIGGIKYVLAIVSRNGRFLMLYPLTTLAEDDILTALHSFVRDIGGRKPRRMLADRDFKLIGGKVGSYLSSTLNQPDNAGYTHVAGAPAYRQDQNGVVEARWKFCLTLARNWLTSN